MWLETKALGLDLRVFEVSTDPSDIDRGGPLRVKYRFLLPVPPLASSSSARRVEGATGGR